MWQKLKIAENTYYMQCHTEGRYAFCLLTNFEECWHEKLSIEKLLERSQQLNKRIIFEKDTLLQTLKHGEPFHVMWQEAPTEEEEAAAVAPSVLKLKFTVRKLPLKFDWHLLPQHKAQHDKLLLAPLLRAMQTLAKQTLELSEIVRKKDLEIAQYKTEGYKLRRTTVATSPFDLQKFECKHNCTADDVQNCCEFAQQLEQHYLCAKPEHMVPMPAALLKVEQMETTSTSTAATTTTMNTRRSGRLQKQIEQTDDKTKSPRQRKRNALQMQQNHLVNKLKANKQMLQYENSESEDLLQQAQIESRPSTSPPLPSSVCKQTTPPTPETVTAKRVRKSLSQELEAVAKEYNQQQQQQQQQQNDVLPQSSQQIAITAASYDAPSCFSANARTPNRSILFMDKVMKDVRKSPEMEPLFISDDDFDENGFLKVRTSYAANAVAAAETASTSTNVLHAKVGNSNSNEPTPTPTLKCQKTLFENAHNSNESANSNNSEMNTSQQFDAILREWKELEERRLADLRRRREL